MGGGNVGPEVVRVVETFDRHFGVHCDLGVAEKFAHSLLAVMFDVGGEELAGMSVVDGTSAGSCAEELFEAVVGAEGSW